MWMLLVLAYGIIKGIREICKKNALEKNTVIEVLFAYSLVSMIFLIPDIPNAGGLVPRQYLFIALKSFVLFVAWILGFKSLKNLPISIYGVLDLSRVIFATVLGIVILGETPTVNKTIGLVVVCGGLLLLKFDPAKKVSRGEIENQPQKDDKRTLYIFMAFICCGLNAVSGILDKILMQEMTSSQLQFWYMLFLAIYYSIYVLVKRIKISKTVWKNGWVWLIAILLLVMDRALFIANADPASQVTIMTLIKQSSVIVTIVAGKFIYKEKNILHKLLCAGIIIVGILFGVM